MIHSHDVINGMSPPNEDVVGQCPPLTELAQAARRMVAQIQSRSAFLPQAVHEDPQWLMILSLFIAAETGNRLCVSDLCASSGVPATTALRHIAWLEKKHIVVRSPHPLDARRSFIDLVDTARQQVAGYLRSIATLLE